MAATIYIPCWKSDPWLEECVGSLAPFLQADDRLVLIDNFRNTRIEAARALWPATTVVATPGPLGFAAANNFGYRAAPPQTPYAVFLNQDTSTRMGWVHACTTVLDADSSLAAISPGIEDIGGQQWEPNFLDGLRTSHGHPDSAAADLAATNNEVIRVDYMPAAAFVMRVSVIQEIGLFDPIFGSYYEDVDLCRRITGAGYAVAALPAARVRHQSGSATDDPAAERRRQRWIIRNRAIHEVRSTKRGRVPELLRAFAGFPRRFMRAVMRRPGSQSVSSVVLAYADLLRLAWRISSVERDQHAFRHETGFGS